MLTFVPGVTVTDGNCVVSFRPCAASVPGTSAGNSVTARANEMDSAPRRRRENKVGSLLLDVVAPALPFVGAWSRGDAPSSRPELNRVSTGNHATPEHSCNQGVLAARL